MLDQSVPESPHDGPLKSEGLGFLVRADPHWHHSGRSSQASFQRWWNPETQTLYERKAFWIKLDKDDASTPGRLHRNLRELPQHWADRWPGPQESAKNCVFYFFMICGSSHGICLDPQMMVISWNHTFFLLWRAMAICCWCTHQVVCGPHLEASHQHGIVCQGLGDGQVAQILLGFTKRAPVEPGSKDSSPSSSALGCLTLEQEMDTPELRRKQTKSLAETVRLNKVSRYSMYSTWNLEGFYGCSAPPSLVKDAFPKGKVLP